MSKAIWKSKNEPDLSLVENLKSALNAPDIIARMLVQRGIDTVDKVNAYFNPRVEDLHDPFLMKDMDKAIERVQLAQEKKEGVLIYGDYDVDGTTSVALVYSFFKDKFDKIDFYIPDRYKEGYGISTQGIDYAKNAGLSLIIALDCGIQSIDKVEYAKSLGIDFIICDHHLPGETLPRAHSILNPKRSDCHYPYKELSGAGIGFKLVQAFSKKQGFAEDKVMDYIDLVAVSIAADMVDVRGENRVLAYYGLKKLNENLWQLAGYKNIPTVQENIEELANSKFSHRIIN